jgi:hypothetical protein
MSATRSGRSRKTPICLGSFSNEPENRRSAEGAIPGFARKFPRNTRFRDGMISSSHTPPSRRPHELRALSQDASCRSGACPAQSRSYREFDRRDAGLFDGIPCRAKIAGRADERADFLRLKSVFYPACDPVPNRLRLLFPVIESLDRRNAARTGAARLRGRLAHQGLNPSWRRDVRLTEWRPVNPYPIPVTG